MADAGSLHVRIARLMRRWADRIDREHAPRATGYSFTFEPRRGVVFNDAGRGCPVWYLSDDDYAKAHAEAVNPP